LQTFALTNISSINKRETLINHLESLSIERLYSLAEYLHLVPFLNEEKVILDKYNKELLLEIIIFHMTRQNTSQLDILNEMPLYPTEDILWDTNQVPNDYNQQDNCLSLPKLNLQFLTLHDYLLRNYNLFRLEAAYEIRNDIESTCIKMRPYYSYDEENVCFQAWSRMGQAITGFNIIEIGKPNIGMTIPSCVRADVTIDLAFTRNDVKDEWQRVRRHDIGFLVTIKPTNTQDQHYNRNEPFCEQMGLVAVRGCEIEGILDEDGKLLNEEKLNYNHKPTYTTDKRTYRISLDCNQYKMDSDNDIDVYLGFNIFIRRKPKENNFKAILESIRDIMNTNLVVPKWLRDLLLGYGDPAAASYKTLQNPKPIATLDFNDTFQSYQHLVESFPQMNVKLLKEIEHNNLFKLKFNNLLNDKENDNTIEVESYKQLNRGPYDYNRPKRNLIKFTPTQVEAIKSGMEPGLTLIVGPPGTGKTDVAVQIISNIYHNFPNQKTLIVTHSNQALNQLFEKIMHLDIDERHLLRLGHGEDDLDTTKDFSRYGRVNYVLAKRLQLLDEVDKLQKSLVNEDDESSGVISEGASYSCETAIHFYFNFIQPKWNNFIAKLKDDTNIAIIHELFPFKKFFSNVDPLFKSRSFEDDKEIAKGCYR
jgi:intron-binding protein aquarius